ncbi:PLP-dependent cysteine synthase family protein, partial [Lactobacillus delbrueckii]
GIGLAAVASAKGYHLIIAMPETMSEERKKIMRAYGAELLLTPGKDGMPGSIALAEKLVKEKGYFLPMQFENPANPKIHELTTGQEIVNAFAGDLPDAFVAGVGTGGTLTGIGRALKKAGDVKVYALEPAESPLLKEGKKGPHKIQGISAGFIPKTLDQSIYDGIVEVSSDDAFATAREVARLEGFLPGISAGANIHGAIELAKKLGAGKKVVTVAPDNGERYLSTALYQ